MRPSSSARACGYQLGVREVQNVSARRQPSLENRTVPVWAARSDPKQQRSNSDAKKGVPRVWEENCLLCYWDYCTLLHLTLLCKLGCRQLPGLAALPVALGLGSAGSHAGTVTPMWLLMASSPGEHAVLPIGSWPESVSYCSPPFLFH